MQHAVFAGLAVSLSLLSCAATPQVHIQQDELSPTAPTITNIQINTANIAKFDKFEVQFDVATQATQLNFPYEENPPPSVAPKTGVTVDGLFSSDNWATTLVQPGFLTQPYAHSIRSNQDHFVPSSGPKWMVRFAPQQTGTWQFKLRVRDAGGSTTSSANSFSVAGQSANANKQRGFLRVSQTDKRYFEFSDGSPFIGVGFNSAFSNSSEVEQQLQTYAQNRINFLRVWMSGSSMNGSHWTSWSYPDQQSNYLPQTSLDLATTYNGSDVSLRLGDPAVKCLFTDFWQKNTPVQPNTTYNLSVRVKLNNVAGGTNAGFTVKQGGWLANTCTDAAQGKVIIAPRKGTADWQVLNGSYTTGTDEYFLGYVYMAMQAGATGIANIDDIRLWRADDPNQVNLLREPNANAHTQFDPMNAASWDKYIESAERNGAYLKLVIDEKNEWIRNHIQPDGKTTATESNDNFYSQPNTRVRWLHQAWWRYLVARWGYSTAVHSFEFVNEGDPYNDVHYSVANAFAKYVHENDTHQHMVTTSFWAAFPGDVFWNSSKYPDIDYTDLHAYLTTGWGTNASFLDAAQMETRAQYVHGGSTSAKVDGANRDSIFLAPRGITIRGRGEWVVRYWMKTNAFTSSCGGGSSGGQQRVKWMLDGGEFNGGKEGYVPAPGSTAWFHCTSPGGTFNWQQFSSTKDKSGGNAPPEQRIILNDDNAHALQLYVNNDAGTSGTAWFDDVEVVNPNGETSRVVGTFEPTSFYEDTAWYYKAYGDVHGAKSVLGTGKPMVRGEAGLDVNYSWDPDLNKDKNGVWLHKATWAQLSASGMYDLWWWASETVDRAGIAGVSPLYPVFLRYRNFMDGIPVNNGNYKEVNAQTSSANLRAWGQRDDVNGRMHLWVQNTQHTWRKAVNNQSTSAISSGNIVLPNVAATEYKVTWYRTDVTANSVIKQETVSSNGTLTLNLPQALSEDVAVKIERVGGGSVLSQRVFVPRVQR